MTHLAWLAAGAVTAAALLGSDSPARIPVGSSAAVLPFGGADCETGFSSGMTADYVAGGGDLDQEIALARLDRLATSEYHDLTRRVIEQTGSHAVVVYLDPQGRSKAGGDLRLVEGRWQMEGFGACARYVAPGLRQKQGEAPG